MIYRMLYGGAGIVAAVVLFLTILRAHDTPRAIVAAAGVLATVALSLRLLQCWDDTTVLVHVLGLLLIGSVLLGALATTVNAANDAPANPVVWAVLAHRVLCLVVAVMWPHWLARTTAPYRRPLLS